MTVRAKLFATKAHFRPLKTKDDVEVGKEKEIGKAPVERSTKDYKPTFEEIVEHPGKLGIHPGSVKQGTLGTGFFYGLNLTLNNGTPHSRLLLISNKHVYVDPKRQMTIKVNKKKGRWFA